MRLKEKTSGAATSDCSDNTEENNVNCVNVVTATRNQLTLTNEHQKKIVQYPPTSVIKNTLPAKVIRISTTKTVKMNNNKQCELKSNTTDGVHMQNSIHSMEAYPMCVKKTPKFPSRERHMAIRRKNKQNHVQQQRDYVNEQIGHCLYHNGK